MTELRIGIIMNGVTGRMGTNQHLVRSISAIRAEGGVPLADGRRVMPDPILVGRDTKMHELMIFFSTLGGLLVFGAMGFILGPILAGFFMTVWDIFRSMFGRELAESASDVIVTPQSVVVTQESLVVELEAPRND